jgi:hypothetical protein
MNLGDIVRGAVSGVDTVRVVRTAINPLLWVVGLTVPLSCVLAFLATDPLVRILFFGFAAVVLVVAFIAYFILLFRDPDRLQSEEYRLRQRALQMLYRQGASPEIVDVAREIPRSERLPSGQGDGDKP